MLSAGNEFTAMSTGHFVESLVPLDQHKIDLRTYVKSRNENIRKIAAPQRLRMNLKNQMLAQVDLQVFPMENDACIVGIELIREIRVVKPVLSEKPNVALSDQPKAKTIDMGHDIVCEVYRNVIRDLQNSIEFCERIIGWLLPVRKPMTPVQADFAEAAQKTDYQSCAKKLSFTLYGYANI
jgi:hypothetical protein